MYSPDPEDDEPDVEVDVARPYFDPDVAYDLMRERELFGT